MDAMADGSEERGSPDRNQEAIAPSTTLTRLATTREEVRNERENVGHYECNSAAVVAGPDILASVKLRVGGVLFQVEKETLFRFEHTYFHGLFSSAAWQPDADGAYFIDRPALGFDRILEYLSSGKLFVEGLSQLEKECVYSSLDYLLIPYKREWHYSSELLIEGLRAFTVCQLKDGRLCGAYKNDIIVWNVDTSVIAMTMNNPTHDILHVIQLQDGRVCTSSSDTTITLWSIDSGLCELILTGHTNCVLRIIQLFDGRLCSGSFDRTVRIWNLSTGVCEMTLDIQRMLYSIAQLTDGRICCGDCEAIDGTISIHSLLTGECELSWKGRGRHIIVVCIDATRICSSSTDITIRVWNTATGKCDRTLEGHTGRVMSITLMHDGRLCSASHDYNIKLWNLATGECERTLNYNSKTGWGQIFQLEDGRLLCAEGNHGVRIWS